MKKTVFALCFLSAPILARSQGTVDFANGTYSAVRTNTTAVGGSAGRTSPSVGGFDYALLTGPSTVTSLSASAQELLSPDWTFTGIYATNTTASAGGRLQGGANVATLTGWPAGVSNSYVIVGWSTSLAGQDWNAVATQLRDATLSGGAWAGTNWLPSATASFFGVSSLGVGSPGGSTPPFGIPLPALALTSTTPTGQGIPISTGWDLFPILTPQAVPEPGSIALAVLGVIAVAVKPGSRKAARHSRPDA
jgi:hypothetical protein